MGEGEHRKETRSEEDHGQKKFKNTGLENLSSENQLVNIIWSKYNT